MPRLDTSQPAAPGYTHFGAFCLLPDLCGSSHASTTMVSAATLHRHLGFSAEGIQALTNFTLVGADTAFPMAVFCVTFKRAYAYFVFNPLDPESRRLMEECTVAGELQLVLMNNLGHQMSCGLRGDMFGDVLRQTHPDRGQNPDAWIAHAVALAPELPAHFSEELVGARDGRARHYAMLMVSRQRLLGIRRSNVQNGLAW